MAQKLNSVQEFYKGKSIFITGGSGFMGKVLIEKLLYSCSDVKELIILVRAKRGKSANQRVDDFKKLPLFKRVMDEKPDMMDKIIPVFGDSTMPNLGLNEEHLNYVLENSQIVFHLAASLKLEATLKPNVLTNLTATKYVLDLAKRMKNLFQMVHTSTAFCNVEQKVLEEKVYECEHKPMDLINFANIMTEDAMAKIQKDMLGVHPNTYTYTKRLAEILVRDEFENSKVPVCIVRPSIVTPSYQEPVRGWVDSLNGPAGIVVAGAKGVLRTLLLDTNAHFESMPVDLAINGIIMVAKEVATAVEKNKEIPVYNLTVHHENRTTYGYLFDTMKSIQFDYPFSFGLWFPRCTITMNKYYFLINAFLFQWLPAYFIDFLLLLFGQKRFMVRVQEKIAIGMDVLKCFTLNDWDFNSENFYGITRRQTKEEYKMFFIDSKVVDTRQCMIDSAIGGRVYCGRDPLSTLPIARIVVRIQYVIDIVVKGFFLYWIIKKFLVITGLMEVAVNVINNKFNV